MKESRCLRCCRSRSCRSVSSWRPPAPFVTLTHTSRTFHKTGLAPRRQIENLRLLTTTTITPTTFAPNKVQRSAVLSGRRQLRFYSQQSTNHPTMTEGVKWTGSQVRKTFLDFFTERGHTLSVCFPLKIFPCPRAQAPTVALLSHNVTRVICNLVELPRSFKKMALLSLEPPLTFVANLQCPPPRSSLTMTPPCSSRMCGMNQFKPIFLGTIGKTEDFAQLKRATDSQKVYRDPVLAYCCCC